MEIAGIHTRSPVPQSRKEIESVSQKLESSFVFEMLKAMEKAPTNIRKMVPGPRMVPTIIII